jgi:predicted ester cyclase
MDTRRERINPMSQADHVRRLSQAFESQHWEVVEEHLTEDFTLTGPAPVPLNKAQFLGVMKNTMAGLPDFSFNTGEVKEHSESHVEARVQISGTHTGTLQNVIPGIPPLPATGKRVQLPQETLHYTLEGSKISSIRVESVEGGGFGGLFSQLGVEQPH